MPPATSIGQRIFRLKRKGTKQKQDAIAALNSLQTNFAIVEELRRTQSRKEMNERSIPETVEWLRRIGYQVRRPNLLEIPAN